MNNMKNQKGIFLISSYLVLSLLGTFSAYVFLKNASVYWTSERTRNRIIAFHLAESAVDQAIVQLRNNLSYTGQGYTSFGSGGYDFQVETPSSVSNPRLRRIIATGYTPNNAASSYAFARRQIVSYVDFSPTASGTFAVFSNSSVQISGSVKLDSYDSRQGPYESQTPRANGDLGTNTTGAGMVMISGSVQIRGDVFVGPGGNPASVIRLAGSAEIEGNRTAAASRRVLDPVQVPAGCLNQGRLNLTMSTTLTLPSGSYCYSSVFMAGSAKVQFTGPAAVYVTGNIDMAGSSRFVASGELPSNLKFMVQGDRSVSMAGSSRLHGVLYAPQSGIMIAGSAQIFGSVTGNTLQQAGSSKIHYDEALNQDASAGVTNQARVLAWTETA